MKTPLARLFKNNPQLLASKIRDKTVPEAGIFTISREGFHPIGLSITADGSRRYLGLQRSLKGSKAHDPSPSSSTAARIEARTCVLDLAIITGGPNWYQYCKMRENGEEIGKADLLAWATLRRYTRLRISVSRFLVAAGCWRPRQRGRGNDSCRPRPTGSRSRVYATL